MAFLGDFGKFFGLGSSKEVLGDAGAATAMAFGLPPESGRQVGRTIARATDNLAGDGSNISPLSTADQALEQSAVPVSQAGAPRPMETANVGLTGTTQQAGLGSLIPGLIGGARTVFPQIGKFIGTPAGSVGTGIATGVGINMFQGQQNFGTKTVLTQSRRNKARVRQLVNFMGIEGAAQFLSQAMNTNVMASDVVNLLLRTFRNDGAYITKAQVRNLRRTTNRFKSLEKQVKEATSMTRTTRRPAIRRASSTTLIKN
jgi:hypothetical protein|tara:strand:- start:1221 stop:1994 length:774 start_codon:yes stop_codon:yes gene_type:complete